MFEKEYPECAAKEPAKKRKRMGKVYAGPEPGARRKDEEREMKDVYAGPDFYEQEGKRD